MHSWKSCPGPSRPGSQHTAAAPCDQATGSTLYPTHPTDSEQCRPRLYIELPTLSDSFLWAYLSESTSETNAYAQHNSQWQPGEEYSRQGHHHSQTTIRGSLFLTLTLPQSTTESPPEFPKRNAQISRQPGGPKHELPSQAQAGLQAQPPESHVTLLFRDSRNVLYFGSQGLRCY